MFNFYIFIIHQVPTLYPMIDSRASPANLVNLKILIPRRSSHRNIYNIRKYRHKEWVLDIAYNETMPIKIPFNHIFNMMPTTILPYLVSHVVCILVYINYNHMVWIYMWYSNKLCIWNSVRNLIINHDIRIIEDEYEGGRAYLGGSL